MPSTVSKDSLMAKQKLIPPSQKTPAARSVVPIPSTIESIKGYPSKLVIFQVPASPYWWVRYYDGRPIKRSAKTTSKRDAITFAKAFYDELNYNKRAGISSNPRQSSFEKCADAVIDEDARKASAGELSASYVTNEKSVINGHIRKFFAGYELADIDYSVLDKFKGHLLDAKLATSSVKMHFVFVKKILDYAVRTKALMASPLLPKVQNEDNPRGHFALDEYKNLRRTARKLLGYKSELRQRILDDAGNDTGKTKKLRNIEITDEIALLIPFMLYTFIRPTDIKQMKHRHIQVKQGANGKAYLFMPIPASKAHGKPITSMPRAAMFYERLRKNRLAALAGDANTQIDVPSIDDEYVFLPTHSNRTTAYRILARQFDVLLAEGGLKYGKDGETRTLYSLRHTSLMYRLRYGGEINPMILANNARTSVEMLERFYLSQLESSQVTAQLHAKSTLTPKRKSAAQRKQATVVLTAAYKPSAEGDAAQHGSSISTSAPSEMPSFAGIARVPSSN